MRIIRVEVLQSIGDFARSGQWTSIRTELHDAVTRLDWPPGSGSFTIYPESGKKRGQGNGVKPIKAGLMHELEEKGWKVEEPLNIATVNRPGKLDAVRTTPLGPVALEWETGNISSSHRALNKMALGLMKGVLAGGVLVVPSRKLYKYLTDRVGNISELEPYFDLWRAIPCQGAVLEVVVVEQDAESRDVPRIPKGTDGRALR